MNKEYDVKEIFKGTCHSCDFRHSCCPHELPINGNCMYWKLGKCYTCKFVNDDVDSWFKRGCEGMCFSGCEQYRRDWKKTIKLLKNKILNIG